MAPPHWEPQQLERIFLRGLSGNLNFQFKPIRANFWYDYRASLPAQLQFNNVSPVDRLCVLHTYRKRAPQGLWWWTAFEGGQKSVGGFVRSYYIKRVRKEIKSALEQRGFNHQWIKTEGGAEVKGSLQLFCNKDIVGMQGDEIRTACNKVVDHVLELDRLRPTPGHAGRSHDRGKRRSAQVRIFSGNSKQDVDSSLRGTIKEMPANKRPPSKKTFEQPEFKSPW